jgi:hypothetical protein
LLQKEIFSMKHVACGILLLLTAAATAAVAQTSTPRIGTSYGMIAIPSFFPPALDPIDPVGYWTNALGLNSVQQSALKTILADRQSSAKALRTNLEQASTALAAAAEANSADADLDRLSTDLGSVFAQAVAVEAKAHARFYALLTADQKQKFDKLSALPAGARLTVFESSSAPGASVKQ